MPAKPVSFCIVNFNGEDVLAATLTAVRETVRERGARASGEAGADAAESGTTLAGDDVILVDDASNDRSVEIVERGFPFVHVVRQTARAGPAAARNIAWRLAAHDTVLFLDNDLSLASGCVDALAAALDANPRAVAAMPCVVRADAPDTVQYDGAGAHVLGLMTLDNAEQPLAQIGDATREIGSIVSCCMMVDRRRFDALGFAEPRTGAGARAESLAPRAPRAAVAALNTADPFDAAFGIYLEDHDFGLRVRLAGSALLAVPRARAMHGRGTRGLSLRRSGVYARARVVALMRNRWRVLLRNYALRTLIVLAPALAVFELAQLAGALARGWLGAWWQALGECVRSLPAIARDRGAIQRARRVPDRALLACAASPFARGLARHAPERLAQSLVEAFIRAFWSVVQKLL
ncbi:MAG: glycosyltransferase family 2 protein [bacterium]